MAQPHALQPLPLLFVFKTLISIAFDYFSVQLGGKPKSPTSTLCCGPLTFKFCLDTPSTVSLFQHIIENWLSQSISQSKLNQLNKITILGLHTVCYVFKKFGCFYKKVETPSQELCFYTATQDMEKSRKTQWFIICHNIFPSVSYIGLLGGFFVI